MQVSLKAIIPAIGGKLYADHFPKLGKTYHIFTTTVRTQKYVIINWKVVVIQQLGNYVEYHRHLIMHTLDIAYTSKA